MFKGKEFVENRTNKTLAANKSSDRSIPILNTGSINNTQYLLAIFDFNTDSL